MRLLEYQVDKFFDDCVYKDVKKHECTERGFYLGTLMFQGIEFWLSSKDCTDEDFIRAVYKKNVEENVIPESEFFEILARFLCGYDKQVEYRKDWPREESKLKYFSKLQNNIDSKISNKDLLEKLNYIECCIKDL